MGYLDSPEGCLTRIPEYDYTYTWLEDWFAPPTKWSPMAAQDPPEGMSDPPKGMSDPPEGMSDLLLLVQSGS